MKPPTPASISLPNEALFATGAALGLLNAIRHRVIGYTTPTDFAPQDISRGVEHVLNIYGRWQRVLGLVAPRETFSGKRVLEVGPGQSLGTGFALLASGASAYHAVDAFPLAHKSPTDLYRALGEKLGAPEDLMKQLTYQTVTFPTLEPLEGTFDVVVSNAALEHWSDVPATFLALRSRVRGFMLHHVDCKTHMRWLRDLDPWNILRYPDSVYRAMSFPGVPNRLLADDYVRAAMRAGFTEVRIEPASRASPGYLGYVRGSLAPQFRGRRDLEWLSFTLFAQ